jgi:hypothetical protein
MYLSSNPAPEAFLLLFDQPLCYPNKRIVKEYIKEVKMKKLLLITMTLVGAFSLYGADAGYDADLQAAIDASLAGDDAELQRAIQLSLQPDHGAPGHHHHGAPAPAPAPPSALTESEIDAYMVQIGRGTTLNSIMQSIDKPDNKIQFLQTYFKEHPPIHEMLQTLEQNEDKRSFMNAQQAFNLEKEKERNIAMALAAVKKPAAGHKASGIDGTTQGTCTMCGNPDDPAESVWNPCKTCEDLDLCLACYKRMDKDSCAYCKGYNLKTTIPKEFGSGIQADLPYQQIRDIESRITKRYYEHVGYSTSAPDTLFLEKKDLHPLWNHAHKTLGLYRLKQERANSAEIKHMLESLTESDRIVSHKIAGDEELVAILIELIDGHFPKGYVYRDWRKSIFPDNFGSIKHLRELVE